MQPYLLSCIIFNKHVMFWNDQALEEESSQDVIYIVT